MEPMPYLQTLPDGRLLLKLHVQPRASQNRFAGQHGDALKLLLTAPPVDGQANKAVIAFIAKVFKVPKSAVVIRSGHKNRVKQVVIRGADEITARKILAD